MSNLITVNNFNRNQFYRARQLYKKIKIEVDRSSEVNMMISDEMEELFEFCELDNINVDNRSFTGKCEAVIYNLPKLDGGTGKTIKGEFPVLSIAGKAKITLNEVKPGKAERVPVEINGKVNRRFIIGDGIAIGSICV